MVPPQPLDRFVGRAPEISGLRASLAARPVLVSIVGAPGIGKSRLAIEVLRPFDDVIPLVLDEIRTADELRTALVRAFAVPVEGTTDTSALDRRLAARIAREPVTVFLDGAQSLDDDARALLARWVAGAPAARWIATSWAPLRIGGEIRHELGPLSTDEAIALFSARAAEVRPGAVDDAAAVAPIVASLEGHPLAIEVVAARAGLLSLEDLGRRVDEILRLPAPSQIGRRTSVEAALEAALDALEPAAARALARASVFTGSFDLAAAEAVIGDDLGVPVLALLDELRGRALLRRTDLGRETRFSLLGAIRAFSRAALAAMPDRDAVVDRHLEHVRRRANEDRIAALGRNAMDAIASLRAAHGDLIVALAAARERDVPAALADLALACDLVHARDRPIAGRLGALEEALRAIQASGRRTDARDGEIALLLARAEVHRLGGDLVRAVADVEAAAGAAEASRGRSELDGELSLAIGIVRREQGRLDDAIAALDRARAIGIERARPRLVGLADLRRGAIALQRGHHEEADRILAGVVEALADADPSARAAAFRLHGHVLLARGLREEARRRFDAAEALARAVADLRAVALAADDLAALALDRRDWDAAETALAAAEAAFDAIGDDLAVAMVLTDAATVALARRQVADVGAFVERAAARMRGGGSARQRGYVLARRGAHLAIAGRLASASDAFDECEGVLRDAGDAQFLAMADGLRQLLDRALAERARAEGDLAAAEEHETRARRRAESLDRAPDGFYVRGARTIVELAARVRPRPRLTVASDGSWVQLGEGARIVLARRVVMRRLVQTLVAARVGTPGRALEAATLIAAAWPGERMRVAAATNRLYVAITRLRALGLRDVIQQNGEGYLLDPEIDVETAS
jgi:predicted ATPase